ncbi:MAG TPA: phosphatase PAP2 family protein [Desulfuromonadales bacterium]|nr:phosphatase PAP2 family protein [Desulfuromonadales bacterium]
MLTVLFSGAWAIHLEPIERLDRLILEWLATGRSAGLDQLFSYISWAGSSVILLPVIFAQLFVLILRKNSRDALFLVGSCIGGSLLGSAAKLVVMRPRPGLFPAVIDLPAGFSFPSSHAVQLTVFVIAELLLLDVSTRPRWLYVFTITGGVLILLVCISRVYLQVHYPTDVVTGFITGLFWVVGLAAVMRSGHNKRAFFDGRGFEKGKQQ